MLMGRRITLPGIEYAQSLQFASDSAEQTRP